MTGFKLCDMLILRKRCHLFRVGVPVAPRAGPNAAFHFLVDFAPILIGNGTVALGYGCRFPRRIPCLVADMRIRYLDLLHVVDPICKRRDRRQRQRQDQRKEQRRKKPFLCHFVPSSCFNFSRIYKLFTFSIVPRRPRQGNAITGCGDCWFWKFFASLFCHMGVYYTQLSPQEVRYALL